MDASPGQDADPGAQQACSSFADAFCNKLQMCSSFVLSVLYGDAATCKQRWALNCLPNFGVPGTSATPARTMACQQSIAALGCPAFLLAEFDSACLPAAGTIPQGGPCGDDAQCATTFCARSPNAICGTCQPTTQPGAPCVQDSCSVSTGTICPANTSTCVKPAAGQVGAQCVGQEQCDVGHMVGCNTSNNECVAMTLASGNNCGANTSLSNVTVCPAGGTCSSPLLLTGRCQAAAADGQSCSTSDTGVHCMQPARCVGGRCTLPDPSTCR